MTIELTPEQVAETIAEQAYGKPPANRMMRMQMQFDSGLVVFVFPSVLTGEDIDDVEALLALTMKGIRRRATLAKETTA